MSYVPAEAKRDVESALTLFDEDFADDPSLILGLVPQSFDREDQVGAHFTDAQLRLLLAEFEAILGTPAEEILGSLLSDDPKPFSHPLRPDLTIYGQLENRRRIYFLGRVPLTTM